MMENRKNGGLKEPIDANCDEQFCLFTFNFCLTRRGAYVSR